MRLDVTVEELGDEVARSVACVTRQDLGFVGNTSLAWTVWNLRDPSFSAVLDVLVAIALIILFLCARGFALKAQDRAIRVEMRMRKMLHDDLRGRIHEFTPTQMVGLRFADDAELPDLARKVLDENITAAGSIKRLITDWQGAYFCG